MFDEQEIGDNTISVGGSSLGGSKYIIERLSNYICNTRLIGTDDSPKQS